MDCHARNRLTHAKAPAGDARGRSFFYDPEVRDAPSAAAIPHTGYYILSTIALPNSEHLSSFAPVIRRSKS
jgi:hypothetical protein